MQQQIYEINIFLMKKKKREIILVHLVQANKTTTKNPIDIIGIFFLLI